MVFRILIMSFIWLFITPSLSFGGDLREALGLLYQLRTTYSAQVLDELEIYTHDGVTQEVLNILESHLALESHPALNEELDLSFIQRSVAFLDHRVNLSHGETLGRISQRIKSALERKDGKWVQNSKRWMLDFLDSNLDRTLSSLSPKNGVENSSPNKQVQGKSLIPAPTKALVLIKKKPLKEHLKNLHPQGGENLALVFKRNTTRFVSDEVLTEILEGTHFPIVGRQGEAQRVLDILTRERGGNALLLGPPGVGKSLLVQKVARLILEGDFPPHSVYQEAFSNAHIVETSPHVVGHSLETYLRSILELENTLGVSIILSMDQLHSLTPGQVDTLSGYMNSATDSIKLIASTTSLQYQNAFKHASNIDRHFEPVGVSDLSQEKILMALKAHQPKMEQRHKRPITDGALEVLVSKAGKLYPDTSLVDGSSKAMMSLFNHQARQDPTGSKPITEEVVYQFVQKQLGYPINPLDTKEMESYKKYLVESLNARVQGQEGMVEDVVQQWMSVVAGQGHGVRTVVMLGPTGVGKSLLAESLAELALNSSQALLEVDGSQFSGRTHLALNTFFGPYIGMLHGDKTAGIFADYLDDPSRGKRGGIILIKSAEKAQTDFWDRIKSVLDTGRYVGNDGKERVLSHHLFILTSTRGVNILYPRNMENWTESEYARHMNSLTEARLASIFQDSVSGRDEFSLNDTVLARVDKFTAAKPLFKETRGAIAFKRAEDFIRKKENDLKIKIQMSPSLPPRLSENFYEKGLGIGPMEKKMVSFLQSALDQYLTENEVRAGDTLDFSLNSELQTLRVQIRDSENFIELPVPRPPLYSPLSDLGLMGRLENLESNLKSQVFGQEEIIHHIAEAVVAHEFSGSGKRPLSLLLVGTTGSGKTELAKALARTLYGSQDKVLILSMGEILSEGELNNIFGSPTGYKGSQVEKVFEKFLRENPQGGVILFDEISNMGGKDKSLKEALFKKFYSFFEEGVWFSQSTNKEYNLGKYLLMSTGNDLESLLQDYSKDDIRLGIWEENKSPQKVRALLRQSSHIPEAFLGRQSYVGLMKPLLRRELDQVTEKILRQEMEIFENEGLHIQPGENFIRDVSMKFFHQSEGARSIRNLIAFPMKAGLARLIFSFGGLDPLRGKTIHLSVEDNWGKKLYITPSTPERKVFLKFRLNEDPQGTPLEKRVDVTDSASSYHMPTRKTLLSTAYHEAGHAVVNDPRLTGQRVATITVLGRDNMLGYVRFENQPGFSFVPSKKGVVALMAHNLAGQMAQKRAGFDPDGGWSSDIKKARILASKYVLQWGLGEDLDALHVDKRGNPLLSTEKKDKVDSEVQRLFHQAEKMASERLEHKWELIRAVVLELYKNGEIKGDQFQEMRRALDPDFTTKDLKNLYGEKGKPQEISHRDCHRLLL